MAKIQRDDDYPLDVAIDKPKDRGTAFVICHNDDAIIISNALKEIGITFRRDVPARVERVACDVVLNTADIKDLQSGEMILLNEGPFGIYVILEKTPLDYLDETRSPFTNQQESH